jgi:twitching motility protein PilT
VPQIDSILKSFKRLGAKAVVLASGRHVTMRFLTGDRFSIRTTPHADVVAIVEEIAPTKSKAAIRASADTRFPYRFEGQEYQVLVEPWGTAWRVTVEPPGEEPGAEERAATFPPSSEREEALSSAPEPTPPPPTPAEPTREPASAAVSRPLAAEGIRAPGAISLGAGGRDLDRLLVQMRDLGASDLHLSTGSAPFVRLGGGLKVLTGYAPLSAEALLDQILQITPGPNRAEFETRQDTDFAYSLEGVARFRVNLFRDRKGPGVSLRLIPFMIPTPEQLGLPSGVLDLCHLAKGLILAAGPAGCGKSTTLATLVDYVNEHRSDHIITIEDPIEFVHESKRCLVNQREVGSHTRSFRDALAAALREDPDIVVVGELRDPETITAALETAETGHLVLATVRSNSAPSAIDRLLDHFPQDRQRQIRVKLAEALRGVVAQVLCDRLSGGRVAAFEVLTCGSAAANLIREGETFQLFSLMQTGRSQGMITLSDFLLDLVRRRAVDPQVAYLKAPSRAEFVALLTREGYDLGSSG